ncbi:MAG: hypothetical protein ABI612_24985, partial [Betaproteobacteria bacterium]
MMLLVALVMLHQMLGLRTGRPRVWLSRLMLAAMVITTLTAMTHFAWVRSNAADWQQIKFADMFVAVTIYLIVFALFAAVHVACTKEAALRVYTNDAILANQCNLLDPSCAYSAKPRLRFFLPPLNRLPGIAGWLIVAAL